MAKIIGQVESLKHIRNELDQNGITRFNSIGEIHNFLAHYNDEVEKAYHEIKLSFANELEGLHAQAMTCQKKYKESKNKISHTLHSQMSLLNKNIAVLKMNTPKYFLNRLLNWAKLKRFQFKKKYLKNKYIKVVNKKTRKTKQQADEATFQYENLARNSDEIISSRCQAALDKLVQTKDTLERLDPLIAGAIGEYLVVKEVKKLSDKFILINDFYVEFDPPIYNRNENDRIYSIQIDHLLVTSSGIFILETKNWSKKSIENYSLRSPVEQIKRTSYALFVLLNNSEHGYLNLNRHHWGPKKIPIRNVVVMIHEKPKEKFKFVTIKSLPELNNYLKYFEPIFTESEVKRIYKQLQRIMK